MEELIQKITEWPVIIQGALGSALFGIFIKVVGKITSFVTVKLEKFSTKSKIHSINLEIIKLRSVLSDDPAETALGFVIQLYYAMYHIVLALIMIVLGLILQTKIYVFGIVGYFFGLYFHFRALNTVRDSGTEISEDKIELLEKQIEELKKT